MTNEFGLRKFPTMETASILYRALMYEDFSRNK